MTIVCLRSTAIAFACAAVLACAHAADAGAGPPASAAVPAASAASADDARQYVTYTQDFAAQCVARNGVQILVSNSHPTRTLRVWFDRYHMGTGTGDRSRSELPPHGEPEPLGCSRTPDGPQEWRLVKAVFVD